MKRMLFFLAVVSLSVVEHSYSQSQSKVLTFEDAVSIAMKNSVLLNTQRNNLELSQMQKMSSLASAGPNVQVNSSLYQVNGNSFNNQTGKLVNGVRDAMTGSISANMNIFSGFNRVNLIKQFSNQLDAQSYFVNRTAQDVINTVGIQYLTVMLDVELMKIAFENWEALKKQLEQIKEQVNLGARSPVDEYNQDAQTKAAELRYVQAEILLNNDKSLLVQTLLVDPFEQFDVEKPNWDMNVVGKENLNPEELADKAKQYRGDYLRAVKNEEGLRYGMRAAKGLMMPNLSAFANYGSAYNYQHGIPQTVDSSGVDIPNKDYPKPFKDQFRTNNVYKNYGLQLTIPIFNGLQNRQAFTQQKVLYENSQQTRKNLEYQIRNDVARTVRNYEGAKKAFSITTDQLKAAEIAFSLEKDRFELGVTSFVDYYNANRVYVQAQTDKAQAEYRLVFQKILIEYAVGTLKAEDLQQQ